MAQYVCRYRKGEELRWIGHLDLKRTLERALRRAQLPLELSQGHNPHPKLSYGPPMPLGATGEAELFSLSLCQALTAEEVKRRLNEQLPPGFEVVDAWVVPGYKKKETFGELDIAEYVVTLPTELTLAQVRDRLGALLTQEELIVSRQGEHETRELDVRPMILSLSAEQVGEGEVAVHMRLRTGSHGGAKPQEIVTLLDACDPTAARVHRLGLYAGGELPPPTAPRPQTGLRRKWGRTRGGP